MVAAEVHDSGARGGREGEQLAAAQVIASFPCCYIAAYSTAFVRDDFDSAFAAGGKPHHVFTL